MPRFYNYSISRLLSANFSKVLRVGFIFATSMLNLFLLSSGQGVAQTTPPKPAPKVSAPKPAPKPAEPVVANAGQVAIAEAQPVSHARSAAISACLPAISELSRLTLDGPHSAISTWNKVDANDHMFSSIVGLKYENTIAPRAIAVLAATPNSKKACDGGAIQIQPSSLSCEAIQNNIKGANLKAHDLNGVTLLQGEGPLRFALLPTSGNGCTVVSVGAYFAK